MSFQNNDSSDFDFSIIDKKPPEQAKLNFSVESLLQEHHESAIRSNASQSRNRNTNPVIDNQEYEQEEYNVNAQNGSFLQDLQKLQQELSFETQLYDVYHEQTQTINSNSLNCPANKSYLHAKSNSHLKTTKQESNNQHTLQHDDYGYLVLDFATKKRKKSSKLYETEKIHQNKMYTQHATSTSHKLKLSSSSGGLTENVSMSTTNPKTRPKNSSLNKLLSPKLSKRPEKSSSKDKDLIKVFKSKSKQPQKQLRNTLQKTSKILSKNKSPQKYHLNNSKKTNASTTLAQTSAKTSKSYTKSTRQANAYSEYYGFQQMGDSQRLVMKSNCLHSSASEKNIISSGKRSPPYYLKKSASKSKCKKSFHSPSPSSKDLTMRFKKKKAKQVN